MAAKRKRHTAKQRKSIFADIIIVICIMVGTFVTASTVYEYHRLDTVMPPDLIRAFWVFWGSELLIVALRQVFGSDVLSGRKSSDTDTPI